MKTGAAPKFTQEEMAKFKPLFRLYQQKKSLTDQDKINALGPDSSVHNRYNQFHSYSLRAIELAESKRAQVSRLGQIEAQKQAVESQRLVVESQRQTLEDEKAKLAEITRQLEAQHIKTLNSQEEAREAILGCEASARSIQQYEKKCRDLEAKIKQEESEIGRARENLSTKLSSGLRY